MLCVLLAIGMLDQSGGLLFLSMYGLVSLVAAQYRHHGVTMLAPLSTISLLWLGDNGIAYSFLETTVFSSDPAQINEIRPPLWFTPVTGTLVAAHMLMPIAWSIREVQLKEEQENPFPYFLPMVWFVRAWSGTILMTRYSKCFAS